MLVQPQQAATVCELDLVQHIIGSLDRAQTLDPNQPPENSHEPLNLTLDHEYAHVSSLSTAIQKPRSRHWSRKRSVSRRMVSDLARRPGCGSKWVVLCRTKIAQQRRLRS